ncbi:hypothetical protein Plec18167_008645 [Paecilomyces lecythidis]|uniref:Plasma membrane channel protein n=1 Tax=Paecilomyces lecythidis TaxID=3004212 RepID=A0ABR3WV64_9EURO
MAPPSPNALQGSFDVDYVIRYRFADTDPSEAAQQLERLLRALTEVGLQTEVRHGDETSLLVFVRAAKRRLAKAIHRSRVRDWLYGVRNQEPDASSVTDPQTEAERLRVIFQLITFPKEEGGADITPKHGEWENVEAIFALHDDETNRKWMRDWSQKTLLTKDDLDQIRNKFGEKVGFYFAFLQSYFKFLVFPAAFGFSCWLLLGHFSVIYTVGNCLSCLVFVEYWKRQETDLSIRWQTKGVSALLTKRREFKAEKVITDEVTGEKKYIFPATKRLSRQLLQVPFALLAVTALGAIIATCFAIEIFISEIYNGPLKTYLVFIPTILLSALVPTISALLVNVATRLNDLENYETQESYDVALTRKIFVLNFIVSYLPIILTAFVYVPFAGLIVPYLDVFKLTVRPFVSKDEVHAVTEFQINPDRLRKQVIYFTVTAQIVNFAMETIVPYAKRKLFLKYKEFSDERKNGSSNGEGQEQKSTAAFDDPPEEAEFLVRVRRQAELSEYTVTDDLREMCIQFGYLALFSPVWPLVPVSFLINNWVELRGDFFKICKECRRPTPERTDTIGPWLDTLGLLSWLGSITSSALVYMFNGSGPEGTPSRIQFWALLLTIFFSEHLYLLVRAVIAAVVAKVETPSIRQEKAEMYTLRRKYLQSAIDAEKEGVTGEDVEEPVLQGGEEKITRESLEEDARASTLRDSTASDRFWGRQRGWQESVKVGAGIIEAQATKPDVKKQQ